MPIARFVPAIFALLVAPVALASQRTFVSTLGVNNPACSIAAPCRDFAAAIAATSPSGEVIVLDSGGYGSVTIGQAVSIIAPSGVYAGISVFAGDGVTVAAGPADKVTLRGLSINGQGGNRGIVVGSGGEVNIEQCIVTNLGADGIRVNGGHAVYVRGSIVRGNGGHGLNVAAPGAEVHALDSNFSSNLGHGILVAAGSLDAARIAADINGDNGVRAEPAAAGTVSVTLTDSSFQGNTQTGAAAATTVASSKASLSVARSTSSRNGGAGFGANSFDVGTAFLTVADSAALENDGNGVVVNGANATGIVNNSTLARNLGFDLDQKGGSVLRTSGNSGVTGRGAPDIGGTLTSNPLK